MYQKTVEFITFVLIIQEKFTLSIYTMFTKTNGQLPNIDYDDGQNRLVDKVVLQVSVQQQKQPDQAGKGSHHKQIETDENPETLKFLKFQDKSFAFVLYLR